MTHLFQRDDHLQGRYTNSVVYYLVRILFLFVNVKLAKLFMLISLKELQAIKYSPHRLSLLKDQK